jgi:hypothetical protein
MTDREAMKLALFALDIVKIHYTQSRHINEAITAIKERLEQPEQEPDYWLGYGLQAHTEKPFENATALYRDPPQRTWVGLTDEEKNDCLVSADPCETLAEPEARQLIEDVEQALKEKNSV